MTEDKNPVKFRISMSKQTNSTVVRDRVWSIVNALPHRSAIAESDARGWVDEVVNLHGEQAIWHAIRLNGFGGSEIGVLVRNRGGIRADHQASAHDIVAGKLMRKAPTETSSHMTRGHENEEPHARRFYQKYGASRDLEAFEALKNAQGKRPWMRYSPDDVVQMPVTLVLDESGAYYPSQRDGAMRRWLIDYKAPSKVEQSDEIAFQYACQLSQGAILCAETGVNLHGTMLSQFDWANWSLKDDVILWDQSLGELVLDAGNFYWEMVSRGEVPDYIRTPEVSGMDSFAADYMAAAEMYASLSAMSAAADQRAQEIRKRLLMPIEKMRLAGQKITFGIGAPVLTIGAKQMLDRDAARKVLTDAQLTACSSKPTYDGDAMASHLRAAGVDLKQFREYDLDATKVYAMASEAGLDAEALVAEQITLTAGQSVKQKMIGFIDEHYPLSAATVAREVELLNESDQAEPAEVPVT